MKVSARNAFKGQIQAIHPGAVNSEVEIVTAGGDTLIAIVTASSIKTLGLAMGSEVTALVKAPWVIVSTDEAGFTFSARNQLRGTVSEVIKGSVNTEVGIALAGGTVVYAVVTNESSSELGLTVGKPASAIIKASHVILAVSKV